MLILLTLGVVLLLIAYLAPVPPTVNRILAIFGWVCLIFALVLFVIGTIQPADVDALHQLR